MRYARRGERGQVLPMWVMGTIATLTLAFLAINYANIVRWQIRAQNGADGAAEALVASQADQWNQMEALLYAANVEEYRIRRLLDGMLLAINSSGGCNAASLTSTAEGSCNRVYTDLRSQYILSVQRYTEDVVFLHSIAAETNQTTVQMGYNQAAGGGNYFCNQDNTTQANWQPPGSDCRLKYSPAVVAPVTGLGAVESDGINIFIPGLGKAAAHAGLDSENAALFAPLKVEIVTCARVPPIIPSFTWFHWPTYTVIGRAAASPVMVEQDWLEPGQMCDPNHSGGCATTASMFQPTEDYTKVMPDLSDLVDGVGYNWYNVNYGGNDNTGNPVTVNYQATVKRAEMSAMFGWWGSMPIKPFGPAVTVATAC